MDSITIISLGLSSGFASVLVTSLFTKNQNKKNDCMKYITEERQKWRVRVKENIVRFCNLDNKKQLEKLKTEMHLSLNPNDDEDKKIITVMEKIILSNDNLKTKEYKNKLEELGSQLLKHDWERAKKEAKSFSNLIPKSKRVIVNCDVLSEVGGSENKVDKIIITGSDKFSKLYDLLTNSVIIVPLILFIGRLIKKFIIKDRGVIGFNFINVIIIIIFLIAIGTVYFMHRDERYKLYIGDAKCQVGEMLIALLIAYFMPNTENFEDIMVNFTLIITALFFISDGLSDMNSIWESIDAEKKAYNNSTINRNERIKIIKVLNNIKFLMTSFFIIVLLSAIIYVFKFYAEININITQNDLMTALWQAVILILIVGIAIPTIPAQSKLLKLVCIFAKDDMPSLKMIDTRANIINTLILPSKLFKFLYLAYLLGVFSIIPGIIVMQKYYLLILLFILVFLPKVVNIVLMKFVSHKLNKG